MSGSIEQQRKPITYLHGTSLLKHFADTYYNYKLVRAYRYLSSLSSVRGHMWHFCFAFKLTKADLLGGNQFLKDRTQF